MNITFELVVPEHMAADLVAEGADDGSQRSSEPATDAILESYVHDAAEVVTIVVGLVQLPLCIADIVRRMKAWQKSTASHQAVSVVVRGAHDDLILRIEQSSDAAEITQQIQVSVTK